MSVSRPFRFGIHMVEHIVSRAAWYAKARKAEESGYDILYVPDHISSHLAYAPILAAAAAATTTLRIGTFVLNNDFRHPAIVAADAVMLDLLSDGRFELGIGAGWLREDYDRAGIPFDRGIDRFNRLTESVHIIKGLCTDAALTFSGKQYTISDLQGVVRPMQRSRPPILIGGGRRRILTFAAQEADIVSIVPRSLPGGGLDGSDHDAEDKLDWIRQAAGKRFDTLELNTLVQRVIITADVQTEAAALAAEWGSTTEMILGSPYVLIGSIEQIVETLYRRRERFGISYVSVFERDFDAFVPIIAHLAGV